MHTFFSALGHIDDVLYKPNLLIVQSVQEEKQNAKYGAGIFQLSSKTIRFRVAKKTPTKIGQFVAFWEKDEMNQNRPFLSADAPDLLVITTFENDHAFGQFIFPKDTLIQQNILRSGSSKGRMAIRVYPVWDYPTSQQAQQTQAWQLPYFVDMREMNPTSIQKSVDMYT